MRDDPGRAPACPTATTGLLLEVGRARVYAEPSPGEPGVDLRQRSDSTSGSAGSETGDVAEELAAVRAIASADAEGW